MGVIISIFSFLWRALRVTLGFICTIPGMIFTAIFGWVGAIAALVRNIGGCCTSIVEFFSSAISHVEAMIEVIGSQPYWGFFYELFALDTFGEVFTYFLGLVIALLSLSVFEIFFQGVVIAVPFLIFKSIGKVIQVLTLGFSKPA